MLEVLITRGGDVNVCDIDDWSPLMWAACKGYPSCLQVGIEMTGKGYPSYLQVGIEMTGKGYPSCLQVGIEMTGKGCPSCLLLGMDQCRFSTGIRLMGNIHIHSMIYF